MIVNQINWLCVPFGHYIFSYFIVFCFFRYASMLYCYTNKQLHILFSHFQLFLSALKSTLLTAEALKKPNAPLSKLVGGEAGLGE